MIVKNDTCLIKIFNITNACINLGHWPLHFKMLLSIIIPKPNKNSYDSLKMFWPIVLLNTLGKFIEKVIRERLQFQAILNNFVHSNQLGGLKQQLTTDADIFLTHLIHSEWVKNLQTSILAFDITQSLSLFNDSWQSWFWYENFFILFQLSGKQKNSILLEQFFFSVF